MPFTILRTRVNTLRTMVLDGRAQDPEFAKRLVEVLSDMVKILDKIRSKTKITF